MPILYIPVGIPGCGKSHMGEAVGADATVSTDAIREQMGDVNDQSKNDQVFAQYHEHIGLWLRGGKSVYADATNLDKRARARLRDIVEPINEIAYGVQYLGAGAEMVQPVLTHLIIFRNLEQAIARNQRRDRTVPGDVMLRMIDKYERAIQDIAQEEYTYVTEVSATR